MKDRSPTLPLLIFAILGGVALLLLVTACGEDSDDPWDSLPDCPAEPLFSVLPIAEDRILNCIPLGLYNQPGHVFPSDHQYLDIRKGLGDVTLCSPTDGWIIAVIEVLRSDMTNTEWSMELAPGNSLKIIFGHVSSLAPDIGNQLGTPADEMSYQTGGVTYTRRNYAVKIPVAAGDVIGALHDIPGVNGIDLGVHDRRVVHPFANPRRFEQYGYRHATAFLDYCTPAVAAVLRDFISKRNETLPLRNTEPLAGTVCLDVSGRAQGVWFAPGQPTFPEDPHLALIRNYTRPEKHVFSVGTSIPGLAPSSYEFLPESTGTWNRAFDEVAPGMIYIYSNFTGFRDEPLSAETVILLEMPDAATVRIEKQDIAAGPPWAFSPAAVLFER